MLVSTMPPLRLGVPATDAVLRIGPIDAEAPTSSRTLFTNGAPAFELSFWCGTCPFLFDRKIIGYDISDERKPLARLEDGIEDVDGEIVETFSPLLPEGDYLPLLLDVTPELVAPYDDRDYFTHEQVATWGIDPLWGLPHDPRSHYYRTFETAVSDDGHFYELVIPMVQPNWNREPRVQHYVDLIAGGATPTAVALSLLDRRAPATSGLDDDWYEHWVLSHFLLDGHHKFAAAARADLPVRLLALVSVDDSLAGAESIAALPEILSRAPSTQRSNE